MNVSADPNISTIFIGSKVPFTIPHIIENRADTPRTKTINKSTNFDADFNSSCILLFPCNNDTSRYFIFLKFCRAKL